MPCALSAIWFPEKQRAISTSIACNANLLGVSLGYFFPALCLVGDLNDYKAKFPNTYVTEARSDVFWCLAYQFFLGLAVVIPVVIGMKDRPENDPDGLTKEQIAE
jgi:hypothetical protein